LFSFILKLTNKNIGAFFDELELSAWDTAGAGSKASRSVRLLGFEPLRNGIRAAAVRLHIGLRIPTI
jgi:hypothetical protein